MTAIKRLLWPLLPYQPMTRTREHLDAQYSAGTWEYLWTLPELARFSVLAGYCRFLRPGGSVLEVGCGEGILQDRLDRSAYKRYVGVDLSPQAITRATRRIASLATSEPVPSITFVAADAQDYVPDGVFDIIVFNESLEYFSDPVALVRRYESFLLPDGLFICSIFRGDGVRSRQIWRALLAAYRLFDATAVTNKQHMSWDIRVLSRK